MRANKNPDEMIDRRQHERAEQRMAREVSPMSIIAWLNAEETAAALAAGAGAAQGAARPKQAPRVYRALREANRCSVVIFDGIDTRALPPRNDLRDHSPDGFQFGYGGSGPSQLALAMCADALGDDEHALRVYQQFKNSFVALQTGDEWEISADEVRALIERLSKAS